MKNMPTVMERSETKEFSATVSLCYAVVCTTLSAREATKRLNSRHPTGTRSEWTRTKRKAEQCSEEQKHKHLEYEC